MATWTLGSARLLDPQGSSYPPTSDAATVPDLRGCPRSVPVGMPGSPGLMDLPVS